MKSSRLIEQDRDLCLAYMVVVLQRQWYDEARKKDDGLVITHGISSTRTLNENVNEGLAMTSHGEEKKKLLSTASWQWRMAGSLSLPGCLVGQATRPKRETVSTPSSIFLFSEKSGPDRNHAILASMVLVAAVEKG